MIKSYIDEQGIIHKIDTENKFVAAFNMNNGQYVRSGIIENGKDTGIDPFMTGYPELLDVGAMNKCACAHKCNVGCYQKAAESKGQNMSVENFEKIMKQSEGKIFQCLDENELVVAKEDNGSIASKYIKDIRVGNYISSGNGNFVKVVEKNEKEDEAYEIDLGYGKKIIATADHKFPTKNGLKRVDELSIGDEFLKFNEDKDFILDKLDIVKIIIDKGLDNKFYLSDCPGMKEVCSKLGIKRNANKTVLISKIKDYLDEISYENARINRERSNFSFQTFYEINEDLMLLLGHYVGNGSKRRYTVNKEQTKMINTIVRAVNNLFPDAKYKSYFKNNIFALEFNSLMIHKELFDNIFECRCADKEKQIPNFIFSVSNEMKIKFLRGYFCDGNFITRTTDGKYGDITFNTSSEKLYKDVCLLLASLNVDYSVSTEEAKQVEFSKNDKRIINRKKRYRIRVFNLKEIFKIKEVVEDHRNYKIFEEIVLSEHEEKYLRNRKGLVVKSIKNIGIRRVIDINVDSEDHLFVTSHGIISHNCAIGGKGDPDTHEHFEELLKICRKYNIVPNFTSSGILMTKEKAEICKKYCGSVAISEHFSDYTEKALDMLLEAGVDTNIHYVLSNKTIDIAIERLKNNSFKEGISAVVFLLSKPVGYGKEEDVLRPEDPRVKDFFALIGKGDFHHKTGFDSCCSAGIVNYCDGIDMDTLDYCEGARFSAYIDADMNMMPCSFANQDPSWFMNLNEYSIEEVWNSKLFDKFRYSLKHSCKGCKNREFCSGGCPLVNQITLCNRECRDFQKGE